MNPLRESQLIETRRHFFGRTSTGIGTAALGSLLNLTSSVQKSGPDKKKIALRPSVSFISLCLGPLPSWTCGITSRTEGLVRQGSARLDQEWTKNYNDDLRTVWIFRLHHQV